MERAVARLRVVARPAVPAAVVELSAQDRLAERRKARIPVQEVRAQAQPEAEMAEVDSLQQERLVDLRSGRHESIEETLHRRLADGWPSGSPHATSSRRVQVEAVQRPRGHSPSRPLRPSSSAIQPFSTARCRSFSQVSVGSSRRSRMTCQRIAGSPARSQSITSSWRATRRRTYSSSRESRRVPGLVALPLRRRRRLAGAGPPISRAGEPALYGITAANESLGRRCWLCQLARESPHATKPEGRGDARRSGGAAAAECAGSSPPPAPEGRTRRAIMEAAGIEPASVCRPGKASTSVGCLGFRPPAGDNRPTDALAILWCRASGDWLSLGAEPVF